MDEKFCKEMTKCNNNNCPHELPKGWEYKECESCRTAKKNYYQRVLKNRVHKLRTDNFTFGKYKFQ